MLLTNSQARIDGTLRGFPIGCFPDSRARIDGTLRGFPIGCFPVLSSSSHQMLIFDSCGPPLHPLPPSMDPMRSGGALGVVWTSVAAQMPGNCLGMDLTSFTLLPQGAYLPFPTPVPRLTHVRHLFQMRPLLQPIRITSVVSTNPRRCFGGPLPRCHRSLFPLYTLFDPSRHTLTTVCTRICTKPICIHRFIAFFCSHLPPPSILTSDHLLPRLA
jgi:hypothetical protein